MKYNITHNIEPTQIEQDIFFYSKVISKLGVKNHQWDVCLHILLDKYFHAYVDILRYKKCISNVYGDWQ